MKLFSFIKSLFSRKSTEDAEKLNCVPTHDVFGDKIEVHDYLVPVEYVDVRRRGYLTIKQNFDLYRPVELKNTNIKNYTRPFRKIVNRK